MTPVSEQIFEPDGRAVPFAEEGDGPVTVVLLPARGLSISSLGTLAHVLEEEGFHMVRIGVRRASGSAAPTMHDLAQDVVDVMAHVGLAVAWIGGHAFGGALARTVALDHPERAEGVLLLGVEAAEPGEEDAARALQTAFSDAAEAESVDAMRVLAGASVDPAFAWRVFSRARDLEAHRLQGAALTATPTAQWWPLAESGPVLIIQGDDDRATPPANGERLQATAPTRASITRIASGGHVFPLTHAGELGAAIEDYLGWD